MRLRRCAPTLPLAQRRWLQSFSNPRPSRLGQVLVRRLGGQWIPRKKLKEAQVWVGQRVWLPFVRAHRYMRSCPSLLDFSLSQFYRAAERHRS